MKDSAEPKKLGDGVSAQLEPKLSVRGRFGEGRPESGVRAAARELGLDRDEVRRSIKIAALPEPAQRAAEETGLDRNQSALLAATKAPDPAAGALPDNPAMA